MPSPLSSSRRRALQTVSIAAVSGLTGCLADVPLSNSCQDVGSLSLDETTPARVSNEFSTPVDGLSYAARNAVAAALDSASGEATARGYYSPKPHTDVVVTGSGPRYYRTETSDDDPATTTGYEYAVDIGVEESAVPNGQRVSSFAELPAQDRDSLREALGNTRLIHAPHYDSFTVTFAYEHADVRSRSVFVPERSTRFVEWEDALLRLRFGERRTVEITTTTVSTELVADSPAAFVEYLGSERGAVLDGLTNRQAEMVSQAIEGTYAECEPYSAGFNDIRERLSVDGQSPAPLARYDGRWYFTGLEQPR